MGRASRGSPVLLALVVLVLVQWCVLVSEAHAQSISNFAGSFNESNESSYAPNSTSTPIPESTTLSSTSHAPSPTSTGLPPPSTNGTVAPSTSAPASLVPPPPVHDLLSRLGFALLIALVISAYYVALMATSIAVGESIHSLLTPFVMLKTLAISAVDCVCSAIGVRRATGYDGLDFGDDDDDPNATVHNMPAQTT